MLIGLVLFPVAEATLQSQMSVRSLAIPSKHHKIVLHFATLKFSVAKATLHSPMSVCSYVRQSVRKQNPSTALILHLSSFNLHPSSFLIHPSSILIHPSSFLIPHSSFIHSSFFIHPSFISQLLSFSACCSRGTIGSEKKRLG